MSCSNQNDNLVELQRHVESLEKKLADSYKPGFGEFMSGIQLHHIKLWFAGQQHNWKLADFEIHEIMEAIDDIQKYDTDRKETRKISMILAPIDSINNAIKNQNEVMFKRSFTLLTNTCNNCHRSNEFEFNVVKIPEVNPFSNQDFRVNEGK
jgi:hypothetical protein